MTPFATVTSVSISPASALGLQRAGVRANDLRLFELASIVREREVPWAGRVQRADSGVKTPG